MDEKEIALKQQIVQAFDGVQGLDIQPTRRNLTILFQIQDTILAVCDYLNELHAKKEDDADVPSDPE